MNGIHLVCADRPIDDKVERPDPMEYTECETCAAKPGSPPLCSGCLNNRTVVGFLKQDLELKNNWKVWRYCTSELPPMNHDGIPADYPTSGIVEISCGYPHTLFGYYIETKKEWRFIGGDNCGEFVYAWRPLPSDRKAAPTPGRKS